MGKFAPSKISRYTVLRMALYKRDCDFNDCELPSGQYNLLLLIE